MRRRHIAALAIFVPVAIVSILSLYYPLSYEMLSGYMFALALVFKGAILSFYSASKLKLIIFLKSMTIVQGTLLLIKRWFLDNIFSKWLKKNIIDHVKVGMVEMLEYYKALNLKSKIKNIFIPIILSVGSAWAVYSMGYLDNILLFTEFKVLIIGVSKTILMMGTKFFGFIINSWITPILEVFALSYIFSWLENLLGKENPIIKALNWIGAKLNSIMFFFADMNTKHIDPLLNDRVSDHSRSLSGRLSEYIRNRRINHEYEQFDKLESMILKGHIDAYYSFKGMSDIRDKKELYRLINKKTDDNLEIVAYVSRDRKGNLISVDIDNSFYHDIFILEGMASSHKHGITTELEIDPDRSDYWILNTSSYPALLKSHSGETKEQEILPHSLSLIKIATIQDYTMGDIYFEYNGRTETAIPVLDTIQKANN